MQSDFNTQALQHNAREALLSQEKAAQYLGVAPMTLQVWRSTRRYPELAYIKVGRLVRYRQSDLQRFVEARAVGELAYA